MTSTSDPREAATPWFVPEQQQALHDFWDAYATPDAEMAAATLRAAVEHPEFGRMMRAMTPAQRSALVAARLDSLQRALAGDWTAFETSSRALGASYARHGIGFAGWYDVLSVGAQQVTPRLVANLGSDAPRLVAALGVLHQFFSRLMAIVGEEYLAVRDAMARASEAACRKADARFARLAEAGLLGVLVTDGDGRVREVNDALLAMIGYTRAEVLAGTPRWRDLTPPEFRDVDERALVQLATTGVAAVREKEYVRRDGSRVPVLAGSAMLEDAREAISFVLDLTERKQAETTIARLRRQNVAEAKLRGLLEAAPDAVVIIGTDGRIALATAQTERVFGYAREDLLGQPVQRLLPERYRAALLARRAAFYSAPDPDAFDASVDIYALRKDGTEFPAEIRLAPVVTEEGTLITASIRDITARKASENALTAANRELEAFSYSVAHDLRAPLRGMRGFAQLLFEAYGTQLDAEGQDWLREIVAGAARMGTLIDALLALARVTRSAMRPERVDLTALGRSIAADLAASEPARSVEFVAAEGLCATLDPGLARSLLENLLGNAWKFTRRTARARVEVTATAVDGVCTFSVRDNGAGFDMAHAAGLFAPFQRLHTEAEFAGTGIGLATVQRIAQRHGGRVWAEGQVGVGAVVHFTLPETHGSVVGGHADAPVTV